MLYRKKKLLYLLLGLLIISTLLCINVLVHAWLLISELGTNFDPEIERTFRSRLRTQVGSVNCVEMGDNTEKDFLEICSTFKFQIFYDESVRLRLFPFSLKEKAKEWLNSNVSGSITSWEILVSKSLNLSQLS